MSEILKIQPVPTCYFLESSFSDIIVFLALFFREKDTNTIKETHPLKVRPVKPKLSKTTYGLRQCPSSANLYLLPLIVKTPVTMAPVEGSM